MSKPLDKEKISKEKEYVLNQIDSFIENLASDDLKKANIFTKQLKQYINMLCFERKFNPSRNIAYERGNVIRVDFGYNVGCELGGPHYAVVLNNYGNQKSSTLNVVPLSSKKDKTVHKSNVDIGEDLYQKINEKRLRLLEQMKPTLLSLQEDAIDRCLATKILSSDIAKFFSRLATENDLSELKSLFTTSNNIMIQKAQSIEMPLLEFGDVFWELENMKHGSVALVSQIKTISKIRVCDPKCTSDILYGISLSEKSMSLIDEKIKERFCK